MTAAPPGDTSLRATVSRALTWSFASTALSRLGTLATGIVLARLLDPHDYGVFTVAMVALVVIVNVNDLGLEQALVRWQGDIRTVAGTATTVIFGSSCLLFLLFWFLAPPLAHALHAPEATGIVRLMAAGVVVNGAFAVPSALLTRTFHQRRRTIADLLGFVVSTAVTVALATLGYGAWSLAWGRVIGNTVNSALHFLLAPARYRPGWSTPLARQLFAQGLPLAGTTLLAVLMVNVDYLVVGRLLGSVELGLYLMAFNLSSWPVSMFSVSIARVSVAGFARLVGQPAALAAAFVRSTGLLMTLVLPVCAGLAALAAPLVRFVYGARWSGAATALTFLAVLGAFRVALQFTTDLLVAVGHGRRTLWLQAWWLIVLVPGLAVGARVAGLRGVAVAHLLIAAAAVAPAFLASLRAAGIPAARVTAVIVRPLLGAGVLAVVATAARATLAGDFWTLLAGGSLGLAAYIACVVPLPRLLGWLRQRGGAPAREAAGEPTAA